MPIKFRLLESENRKTLVLFAAAEFILIIVGILIALQIDNWNENRKERRTELTYLKALQGEFNDNLNRLNRVKKLNARNAGFAHELTEYTGQNEPLLSAYEVDSLLRFISAEVQYRPGSGVLDEIISSGKLGIFKNDQLRFILAAWESTMQAVRFQEQEHARIRFLIMDMCFTEGNTRSMIEQMGFERTQLSPTKFPRNNILLLQDREFDNLLAGFYLTAKFLNENYYRQLENRINRVLTIIEEELE